MTLQIDQQISLKSIELAATHDAARVAPSKKKVCDTVGKRPNRQIDRRRCIASNPLAHTKPAKKSRPSPIPHTSIWEAIAAATTQHKARANIAKYQLALDIRMGKALQRATAKLSHAQAVQSVANNDAKVAASHKDSGFFDNNNVIGWVVAAVTVVACMVVFSPLIGAVVGIATVLMSDDISVDGKPLLNYILQKCHANPLGNKSLFTTVSDLITTKIIGAHSEGSMGGWETVLNLIFTVAVPAVLGIVAVVLVVVAVVVAVVAIVAVIFAAVMAVVAIVGVIAAIVVAVAALPELAAALLLVIPAIATIPIILAPIGL